MFIGDFTGRRQRHLSASNGLIPRFLQTPNEEEVCELPDLADEDLLTILTGASDKCDDVSEEEFDSAFISLKHFFASKSCWENLCDEDYVIALSYKIYFKLGAQCAGVELDLPNCVFDKVIELLTTFTNEDPIEKELFFLVYTYLVTPAIDQCGATEVDADETTSDILAILHSFSSPTCASGNAQMRSSFLTTDTEANIAADGSETNIANNAYITGASNSSTYTGAFIAAAIGCAITILIAGIYRLKKKRYQERKPLELINEAEYL